MPSTGGPCGNVRDVSKRNKQTFLGCEGDVLTGERQTMTVKITCTPVRRPCVYGRQQSRRIGREASCSLKGSREGPLKEWRLFE